MYTDRLLCLHKSSEEEGKEDKKEQGTRSHFPLSDYGEESFGEWFLCAINSHEVCKVFKFANKSVYSSIIKKSKIKWEKWLFYAL